MGRRARQWAAGTALLWGACNAALAGSGLSRLETEHLTLVYRDPVQAYLVPHAARCFENALEFHRSTLGFDPTRPITVLLADFSDTGNASATGTPRNMMLLETSPIGVPYETVSANERMNWLMNHELVHVAAVDQATSSDLRRRRWFGGKVSPIAEQPESILYYYLTTPRDAAPRWYHEGAAVFLETWMAGGVGRAQGAWDEMVFRSMVRDGTEFHDPLGLVAAGTRSDFQVEVNSYLYGTRFLSYLSWTFSPEHVVRWIARPEGSRAYYADQFRAVFGRPLEDLWAEWVEFEREFQNANLERIRQYPLTPYRDLSGRALGSVSRPFYDPVARKVYAALNYPGVVAHLASIDVDDGTVERISDIKGPLLFSVTSVAWDPDSGTLFYTTDNHEYRDLRAVDPDDGQSRTLQKDLRVGHLAFDRSDASLWGVRHLNGIATVVRIPAPYDSWERVHSFPYAEVPYDLDVSPDGTLLSASVARADGSHVLKIFRTADLEAGEVAAIAEHGFGSAIPSNFVFDPEGRYLYGSSYYTGVSNVFRYEVATGNVEALSNTDGGFFLPLPLEDGGILVFRYTGDGFVPARIETRVVEDAAPIEFLGADIVEKFPVVRSWSIGSPAEIALDERVVARGPYRAFREIGVESFYPVLEGYKDSGALGLRLNLSDPLLLNRFALSASYSPDGDLPSRERVHVQLDYQRYDWWASARWNDADFYDLFGPRKTSLKGYSLQGGWRRNLIYDDPRTLTLAVEAGHFRDLDRLPEYQNVETPIDKLTSASAELTFSDVRKSLGAVDDEKGHRGFVELVADYAVDAVPRWSAGYDFGFALPLPHSSIWIRSAAGIGFGDREDPFANFYFGGFGNNWVDHGPVKSYREPARFPGLEIDEVGGRTFARSMVEWNLPPIRFRNVGTPASYLSWARASVFAGGLLTNFDADEARREVGNAGVQVDLRFTVLSRLNMTLSLGWAAAFEGGMPSRDEFMASLNVLR